MQAKGTGPSGHTPSASPAGKSAPGSDSSRKGKAPTSIHLHSSAKHRPSPHPPQIKFPSQQPHPKHPPLPATAHPPPHEHSRPPVHGHSVKHHPKPYHPPPSAGKSMPSGSAKPQAQAGNLKHDVSRHHAQVAAQAKAHGYKVPSSSEQKYKDYKIRQKMPEANHDGHRPRHRPPSEDYRGTKRPHPLGDTPDLKRTRYDPSNPPLPSSTPSLPPLPPLPSSPPPPPPPPSHQYSGLPPNVPLLPRGDDLRLPPLPPPLPTSGESPPPPPPPPPR